MGSLLLINTGVIVSINERACKNHGYVKEDLLGADSGVLSGK